MGTLFERGLDPGKRSQIGAFYTDAEKIMMIVRPVIIEPLLREWETARTEIGELMQTAKAHKTKGERTKAANAANEIKSKFIERLKNFRVLDPACGSGNFLYLALKALKDIEFRVNFEAESLGLPAAFPSVGPECVKGIEINPFAAELARVSVWIGEIQWMREHNFSASKNPILKSLETIQCRDALLNPDGAEAVWPEADAIIGNPPFLGRQEAIALLGEGYVDTMRDRFEDRVPGQADLVAYWFEKARDMLAACLVENVGLVATNSLRRGVNRVVLDKIRNDTTIFDAFADEPWVVEGAAVRVSTVCFGRRYANIRLNGVIAQSISSNLEESTTSLATASVLHSNSGIAFVGGQKDGPFEISGERARQLIALPKNPNGRPNSDVVRPWRNGRDLARRLSDTWIVDFGDRPLEDAALYEAPFLIVREKVLPARQKNRDERRKSRWWLHGRPGSRAKAAIGSRGLYCDTSDIKASLVCVPACRCFSRQYDRTDF